MQLGSNNPDITCLSWLFYNPSTKMFTTHFMKILAGHMKNKVGASL